MPVAVQNKLDTLSCFSDIPTKLHIEWQPRGDADGRDIQYVPDSVLEHPQFLRALGLGLYEIMDGEDPAMIASVRSQAARYAKTTADEKTGLQALIDSTGRNGRDVVFSEADLSAHIDSLSKGKGATLDV